MRRPTLRQAEAALEVVLALALLVVALILLFDPWRGL